MSHTMGSSLQKDILTLIIGHLDCFDKYYFGRACKQFYKTYCEWTKAQLRIDHQILRQAPNLRLIMIVLNGDSIEMNFICDQIGQTTMGQWKHNELQKIRGTGLKVLGVLEPIVMPGQDIDQILWNVYVATKCTNFSGCYSVMFDREKYQNIKTYGNPQFDNPVCDIAGKEIDIAGYFAFTHKRTAIYCALDRYIAEIISLRKLLETTPQRKLVFDKYVTYSSTLASRWKNYHYITNQPTLKNNYNMEKDEM